MEPTPDPALADQLQAEVSEILGGRYVSSYDVLARICEGLGVPRGWMGLAFDDSPLSGSSPADPSTTD